MSGSLSARRLSPATDGPSSAGPCASMGEISPVRPSAAVPGDDAAYLSHEHRSTIPRLHSVGPDAYPNWDAIYLDNVERLYRMMYARVGNRADAEDLTAEVFQATLKPLRTSASVGEVRAYLLATATDGPRLALAPPLRSRDHDDRPRRRPRRPRRSAHRVGRAAPGPRSARRAPRSLRAYPPAALPRVVHAPRSGESDGHQPRERKGPATPRLTPRRATHRSEQMNACRVTAFVDSLRRNRRPKTFTPDPEDVEAMRAAIELNNAEPGAAVPRRRVPR